MPDQHKKYRQFHALNTKDKQKTKYKRPENREKYQKMLRIEMENNYLKQFFQTICMKRSNKGTCSRQTAWKNIPWKYKWLSNSVFGWCRLSLVEFRAFCLAAESWWSAVQAPQNQYQTESKIKVNDLLKGKQQWNAIKIRYKKPIWKGIPMYLKQKTYDLRAFVIIFFINLQFLFTIIR